jgi:hypothetical protein
VYFSSIEGTLSDTKELNISACSAESGSENVLKTIFISNYTSLNTVAVKTAPLL